MRPCSRASSTRDPAGGASPGRAAPRPRSDQPPRAGRPLRRLLHRSGEPPTRSPSSQAGAADNLVPAPPTSPVSAPVVIAPAMNNRMYEHPATQSNLALLRERGARVMEPGERSTRLTGEWGWAGSPSHRSCSKRSSRPPEPGRRCRSTACGCWSRPAEPASHSTRFDTSATARAAGWASLSQARRPAAGRA